MKNLYLYTFVLAVFVIACGSTQSIVSTQPHYKQPSSSKFDYNVDPDIARIFNESSVTGSLPAGISWSKDSRNFVYLRKQKNKEGNSFMGLWIYESAFNRERPLSINEDFPISQYVWRNDKELIVLSNQHLFILNLEGKHVQISKEPGARAIQISPDGNKIAFLRDFNIIILDIKTKAEKQITTNGTKDKFYGDVSWVYGEEFSTSKGFGWSPDSKKLWLNSVDETSVPKRTVWTNENGDSIMQAYPRAGDPNPVLHVGIADISKKDIEINWLNLGKETDVYLPRITWHPSSKRVVVMHFDRLQTVQKLLMCNASNGNCKSILEERDPMWINLLDEPRFLKDGSQFLWISERDGFAHIYIIGEDGLVKNKLTHGDYVVHSISSIDEKNKVVYFRANVEKPYSYGVYKVSFDGGEITRISQADGVHYPKFSPDSKKYIDIHSTLANPPRADLFDLTGKKIITINKMALRKYSFENVTNNIFTIETKDGTTLYAHLTQPVVLDPEVKYPVLVYVYGGPGAQVVQDHFRTTFQPWRNLLASRGILVFTVDNRGSTGRGRKFEVPIHRNLTSIELEDQLEGIEYLKNQPYVDSDRLAIFGWSYGATMTLTALLRTQNMFKAGVAIAPVTAWNLYDSAYTERYMQRPIDNPEGYKNTSLLEVANKLETPLLLVHGLADDNVHPANSSFLVTAFIKAGKFFEEMFYPNKKHSLRGADTRTHVFTKITRFIEAHI